MNISPRQGTATLAVLIDADNAAPAIVEGLLAEVAKYGVAAVKRIYGDWTRPNLAGWKERLLSHSIQPIQQFRYTVGKNATDSAMIIDAMDLLYTGRFDGFCIVSSDSDFTRLASRIREQGLTVYGFGERKTPKPFVTACDKFIYSDVLRADADTDTEGAEGLDGATAPTRKRSTGELRQDSRLVRLLQHAAQAVSDEDGWLTLGGMGNHIAKQAPEFDSRNYGYGKLSELVLSTGLFEVETRNGGNNKTIWVRLKKRAKGGGEADGRGQPQAQAQAQAQPQPQRPAQQQAGHQAEPPRRNPGLAAAQATEPAPVSVPEPVAAQPEPPFVAADVVQPEPEAVPELEAAPQPDPEPTPRGRDAARKRTARPDVTLSETPWPIDQSVFAAPGTTVLTARVEPEPQPQPEPAADAAAAPAPARKTRKRPSKKVE